jgi:hypothetical protein
VAVPAPTRCASRLQLQQLPAALRHLHSSNFTCACIASSGCACQIAPPLPPSSGDLPNLQALFKTGEEGFPCTRFPMMLTAWGKIHAVSEFDAITGDHCDHGSDNAHATGRIAVKTSVDAKTWSAPSYLPLAPIYARDPTVLFIEKIGRLCVVFDAELRSVCCSAWQWQRW